MGLLVAGRIDPFALEPAIAFVEQGHDVDVLRILDDTEDRDRSKHGGTYGVLGSWASKRHIQRSGSSPGGRSR